MGHGWEDAEELAAVRAGGRFDDAVRFAAALGEPKAAGEGAGAYAIVPDDCSLVQLEDLLPAPRRIRRGVKVVDVDSFQVYVTRYRTPGLVVFADEASHRFTALLDGSVSAEAPQWGDHTVTLRLEPGREWTRWNANNDRWFGQEAFAEFLEDNLVDIVEPAAASLLELALQFEARKSVKFESGKRLDSSARQLVYVEEIKSGSRNGEITVPESFRLLIAPWVRTETVPLEAKFRYRIQDGDLALGYHLARPHKALEAAFDVMAEDVAEVLGVPLIFGAVEPALFQSYGVTAAAPDRRRRGL